MARANDKQKYYHILYGTSNSKHHTVLYNFEQSK